MAIAAPSRRRSRRKKRRRLVAVTLVAVVLVVVGAASALWLTLGRAGREARAVVRHPALPAWITPVSRVASVSQPTLGYPSPVVGAPSTIVVPNWAGAPSSLPVLASLPGWLEVSVLTPPAAATPIAWIPSVHVSLTRTPYQVVVDLSRTRVLVFHHAKLVLCVPVGVGTPQTPTPTGRSFVSLFARAPSPAYGPFVMVTSARANTITDWEQSGHSVITIEGPLDSGAAIGATGAQVTTGSIRMLDSDLAQLRGVPTGSPIDVVTTLHVAPAAKNHRHPPARSLRACAT
jgi:L,D-transpeptidase catalytic domain